MVDGLSDRGSTPLRSIEKRGLRVYSQASFFYGPEGESRMRKSERPGFRQGAQGAGGTCYAPTEPAGETDSP